jgi:hypothetical protein
VERLGEVVEVLVQKGILRKKNADNWRIPKGEIQPMVNPGGLQCS